MGLTPGRLLSLLLNYDNNYFYSHAGPYQPGWLTLLTSDPSFALDRPPSWVLKI
jgi:hypothetical protein